MESLKCDFEFDSIERDFQKFNHQKTLIWILHADKIPPHIGISAQGQFFSLKVSGKDEFFPINKLSELLVSKKIATVLIELECRISLQEIAEKFGEFSQAVDLQSSCLVPIKELVLTNEKVNQLKELLEILKKKGLINRVFGLNLNPSYQGIPHYSTDEIKFRLEKLKHAER
jgi:hypothetical protein